MSEEIFLSYATAVMTTLYAVIRRPSDGAFRSPGSFNANRAAVNASIVADAVKEGWADAACDLFQSAPGPKAGGNPRRRLPDS